MMMMNPFQRLPKSLLESTLLTLSSSSSSSSPFTRSLPHHFHRNSSTSSSNPVKLRFAPSPTGFLHLGGLRTALYNHLLSRRLGGSWILRIEDTDQSRYVEGAVESLLRTLKWAKLDFDEGPDKDGGNGPYFQSHRKEIYNRHLQKLIDEGKAYHCFCTPARLDVVRKAFVKGVGNSAYDRHCLGVEKSETEERIARGESSIVRFKSSTDGLVQKDLVYDSIHYKSLPIEDFVLRKSDGLPSYHFANVVDDHEMGVTHVLRGEEWLPSTPKHLALYSALGFEPPLFAHMPILVNPDGSKLSKRAGDVKVEDYITKGYEPEGLLNFVAFLGWSRQGNVSVSTPAPADGETSEILTMQDLIDNFSLEGINKNRATMTTAKLDFLNRAHIKKKLALGNKGRLEMAERLSILLKVTHGIDCTDLNYVARVIDSLKDRIYTINDVANLGLYFFEEPNFDTPSSQEVLKSFPPAIYNLAISESIEILDTLPLEVFERNTFEPILLVLNSLRKDGKFKSAKELMTPIRHALTGQTVGAGIPATIGTLGKEKTLNRLRKALRKE